MIPSATTSILLLAALLFGDMVLEDRTVALHTVTVPKTLTDRGYTSAVVQQRITTAALELVRDAQSRAQAERIANSNDDGPVEVLAAYIGVAPVLQAMQQSTGVLEYSVGADIVEEGQQLALRLRIKRFDGRQVRTTLRGTTNDIEGLLRAGGFALLQQIDPQIACSAGFRRSLRAAGAAPDITGTLACVEQSLPSAGREDKAWLYNLGGVAATLAGDHAAAVNYYRRALAEEPDFSPSLVNLGILFSVHGQHTDAIRSFQHMFHRRLRSDSAQTYAVAFTMWARSLEHTGDRDGALEMLRRAVNADASYPLARDMLLARLPATAPEAAALRAAAQRATAPDIYTDNILGVMTLAVLEQRAQRTTERR